MKKTLVGMLSAAAMLTMAGISMAEAKTLGIVALLANDALNIDVIGGATKAANAAGWDVKVIDTQASADQANAAMSSFAVQKVDVIFVLAFASSAIGSRTVWNASAYSASPNPPGNGMFTVKPVPSRTPTSSRAPVPG